MNPLGLWNDSTFVYRVYVAQVACRTSSQISKCLAAVER